MVSDRKQFFKRFQDLIKEFELKRKTFLTLLNKEKNILNVARKNKLLLQILTGKNNFSENIKSYFDSKKSSNINEKSLLEAVKVNKNFMKPNIVERAFNTKAFKNFLVNKVVENANNEHIDIDELRKDIYKLDSKQRMEVIDKLNDKAISDIFVNFSLRKISKKKILVTDSRKISNKLNTRLTQKQVDEFEKNKAATELSSKLENKNADSKPQLYNSSMPKPTIAKDYRDNPKFEEHRILNANKPLIKDKEDLLESSSKVKLS